MMSFLRGVLFVAPVKVIAAARHVADRALCEMGRNEEQLAIGCIFESPSTQRTRLILPFTAHGVPVRAHDLQWMMHDVAAEQCRCAFGVQLNRHMPDAMSLRRPENKIIAIFTAGVADAFGLA